MMNGNEVGSAAQQVGAQGVDNLVADASRICMYERQRIECLNEPEIVRLQFELAILGDEQKQIAARLAHAPMAGGRLKLRLRRIFNWSFALILFVAGFFSVALSLAPFRLGWMSWLVVLGASVLTAFLVEHLLEHPGAEKLRPALTAIAAIASISAVMLFALIRGNLLAQQIKESENQAVVIDDAQPEPETTNTFYDRSSGMLAVALLLLAFGTELGGGLVLHAAWKSMPDDSEDWAKLGHRLGEIRRQMAEAARQITMLRKAPQIYEAAFMRDFHWAVLLKATRNSMKKLFLIFAVLVALSVSRARAEDRFDLVIAIDLTRSVAAVGPDGKTDFENNVEGVSRVLAQVPAGSRLTIIGITDRSFAEPYVLMRALVPADSGYFGERLNAARTQLVSAWRQRVARLHPDFKQTDIFGALELASQFFDENPDTDRKELIIFSDMRESALGLDFEWAKLVPQFDTVGSKCGALANLREVHIYVLGVDEAGKSATYWQSLQRFWIDYFKSADAPLQLFTVLREVGFISQR